MSEIFAAVVDWGTSSFRVWLLDHQGNELDGHKSPHGMAKLAKHEFGPHLENALHSLEAPGDIPVLMCGMVGAAQGWVQAPYIEAPAKLEKIPASALKVEDTERDVRILPGICQQQKGKWDVMRGEETILYGCSLDTTEELVCLPGTHSKWAKVSNGMLESFSTFMTGELFAMVSENSTLSAYVRERPTECNWGQFEQAVEEIAQAPSLLLNKLFTIRAMPLIQGDETASGMYDRLSGLLIAQEIAGMNLDGHGEITLIAEGSLAERYARALNRFGVKAKLLGSTSMVQRGLFQAARKIWG